ncbi:MAG TPA: FAD-binding oxidoreductase [Solirubrobacteraceae bacterium]|nr:FAD-binding oxidoreductase [Solirubrobacteraceae bacterium]
MALARPQHPHPEPAVGGWGDSAQVPELSEPVINLLRDGLGIEHPPPRGEIELPARRLDDGAISALEAIVGGEHVHVDDDARLAHTGGRSTPDLLRRRAGEAAGAPDAVVLPAGHDEILELLQACTERRIAVTAYGGGSSVVGGLEPDAAGFTGAIALDTRRLDALIGLDEISRLATLEPGLRGPQAEQLLGERGYTLGHFPQSYEYATLGGFAAARSSGQASAGYGRFDELVMALKLATPVGTLAVGRAPRSAAGPDLRQLLLGSEGTLGVITELTLQVRPKPEATAYHGWRFDDFAQGTEALRALAQDGPLPSVLRLSDEAETALNLTRPGAVATAGGGGALAIVGYEGTRADVEERQTGVARVLERHGAHFDEAAGEHWVSERFRGPYLRDALLDAGALVETLETACFWSALPDIYARVTHAIRHALTEQGTPPVVLCHISHVYATGASLYFTIGCAQAADPVAQWRATKSAASDAILAGGASISHHHGIGRDHREWYEREIGELGVRVLTAVKRELDPAGILNPRVLLGVCSPRPWP